MPPSSLLSPSELSYLHTSLSLQPPIRPDARSPTSFRPLIAETDLLPSTNGSARLCFADGTEAIVGVKAELERTAGQGRIQVPSDSKEINEGRDKDINLDVVNVEDERQKEAVGKGQDQWVEVSVDMPGFQRDDDGVVVFLAQMLQEGLVADGRLKDSLWISPGWYWRLYVDILLLSPPNSYPLPLLSLTAHLALQSTRLPAPISRLDEDPYFNDDWDASTWLYSPQAVSNSALRPPFTLLVISVGDNIFFDPSREELAVADAACAVTVGTISSSTASKQPEQSRLKLLSLRTIDPPARLAAAASTTEGGEEMGVWKPVRGGMKRTIVARMVKMTLEPGGVGEEVLDGLKAFKEG